MPYGVVEFGSMHQSFKHVTSRTLHDQWLQNSTTLIICVQNRNMRWTCLDWLASLYWYNYDRDWSLAPPREFASGIATPVCAHPYSVNESCAYLQDASVNYQIRRQWNTKPQNRNFSGISLLHPGSTVSTWMNTLTCLLNMYLCKSHFYLCKFHQKYPKVIKIIWGQNLVHLIISTHAVLVHAEFSTVLINSVATILRKVLT